MIFLLGSSVNGKELPELLAKQANDNLRLISSDGKVTYYQRRSGSLHFSKNYKIYDVLKSNMGTQYTLISTSHKKKILVSQNDVFHTFYSMRMKEKIYILNYGEYTPREIGAGINPALHNADTWMSYYDPYEKLIKLEHTTNYALKFSLKINARLNPYFIPDVQMVDDNIILYTDMGENGNWGIVKYQRNTNSAEIIQKLDKINSRIEITLCDNQLIVGEFGNKNSGLGSQIYKINKTDINFKNKSIIYQSKLDDVGQITCHENFLYFIKNTTEERSSYRTNISEINLKDNQETILTNINSVTSLINMDGIIVTMDRGKYYIVKGNTDLKNVDLLRSESEKTEDKTGDKK